MRLKNNYHLCNRRSLRSLILYGLVTLTIFELVINDVNKYGIDGVAYQFIDLLYRGLFIGSLLLFL